MSTFFSWEAQPAIGEYVRTNYAMLGPTDCARKIQEEFEVSLKPEAIRSYYRNRVTAEAMLADQGQPAPAKVEVAPRSAEVPDQRTPRKWSEIEDMFRMATDLSEHKESTFLGQTTVTRRLKEENLPRGLAFWFDWQVGTSGVMMEQLKQDAETIAQTDGLSVIVGGDLMQNLNMVKHPSSLTECVLPDPRDQKDCVRWLLNKTREKIWGMVTGNHEHNTKKASGFEPTEDFCREFEAPYLWHGAKINLEFGQQIYKIGVRHMFRGESSVNTTNVQRMMHQQLWPDCDVIALGHRHYNDLQKTTKALGETIWLRAGSYQKWDDHGQMSGGYKGSWGIPMVVFYPDKRKVVPFYGSDWQEGLQFLADQRERYRMSIGRR